MKYKIELLKLTQLRLIRSGMTRDAAIRLGLAVTNDPWWRDLGTIPADAFGGTFLGVAGGGYIRVSAE